MALQHTGSAIRPGSVHVLVGRLAILLTVLLFLAALGMAFGVPGVGPTFDIVPDPAGPLPF
jgi:hypothetical protein